MIWIEIAGNLKIISIVLSCICSSRVPKKEKSRSRSRSPKNKEGAISVKDEPLDKVSGNRITHQGLIGSLSCWSCMVSWSAFSFSITGSWAEAPGTGDAETTREDWEVAGWPWQEERAHSNSHSPSIQKVDSGRWWWWRWRTNCWF